MFEGTHSARDKTLEDTWSQFVSENESMFRDPEFLRLLQEAKAVFAGLYPDCNSAESEELLADLTKTLGEYQGKEADISGFVYPIGTNARVSADPIDQTHNRLVLCRFGATLQPRKQAELCLIGASRSNDQTPQYYAIPMHADIVPVSTFSIEHIHALLESCAPRLLAEFDERVMEEGLSSTRMLHSLRYLPLDELDELDYHQAEKIAALFSHYVYTTLDLERRDVHHVSYDGPVMFRGVEYLLQSSSCKVAIDGVGPVYEKANNNASFGCWKLVAAGTVWRATSSGALEDVMLFVDSIVPIKGRMMHE